MAKNGTTSTALAIVHPDDRARQPHKVHDPAELLKLLQAPGRRVFLSKPLLGVNLVCAELRLEAAARPGSITATELPEAIADAQQLLLAEGTIQSRK